MRKGSKKTTAVDIANISSYHGGNNYSESYAFEGFQSNKLFTSDRYINLDGSFNRADGIALDGYGLEIECECWGIKNRRVLADVFHKIIFKLFPDDLFKMQRDGSLGGVACTGVECITQVMKKSFIRNHYKDFKAMFDTYFSEFEISASRSGHCGMHVNISNALFGKTVEQQKEAIRKLHYFVNKNFDLSCRLLKRRMNHIDYCGRMHYENAKTMNIGGGDHYHCINYTHFHTGRVELRLVGGQRDFETFRDTMETVFFLVERMRKIKWDDLDNMVEVFKGCNQYVYHRLRETDLAFETLLAIKENVKEADLELEE